MFWKSLDGISASRRLTLWVTLAGAAISLVAGILVFAISHRQIYGMHRAIAVRMLHDLREEYRSAGGTTPGFLRHLQVDVEEHNAKITQIELAGADGPLHATAPLPHRDRHYVKEWSLELAPGLSAIVRRDINDVVEFDFFLSMLLAAIGLAGIAALAVFSNLIGKRILKLNELVESKDRALDELKTLTDDIAHDLRTPLARLRMAAEKSFRERSGDGRFAVYAIEEISAMVEMINTMLQISQTGFQIDASPREQVDLNAIVRQAAELYEAVAESKRIRLRVEVPASPVVCRAHRAKLQCVVGNLLDNAVKFTGAGGEICLSLAADDEAAVVTCRDNGCGISDADRPHVFQRFYRADHSRHLADGNGLGLALVQAIVQAYGGSVACSSAVGRGSTFTVRLPR